MCFSSKLYFEEKTEYLTVIVKNRENFVSQIVNFFICTLVSFLSPRSFNTYKTSKVEIILFITKPKCIEKVQKTEFKIKSF